MVDQKIREHTIKPKTLWERRYRRNTNLVCSFSALLRFLSIPFLPTVSDALPLSTWMR